MAPPHGRSPSAESRLPAAAQAALRNDIRPKIRAHGGDVEVIEADDGEVSLRFVGACQGCAALPMTYLGVVRPKLMGLQGIEDVDCNQVRVSEHARRRLEGLWASSFAPQGDSAQESTS